MKKKIPSIIIPRTKVRNPISDNAHARKAGPMKNKNQKRNIKRLPKEIFKEIKNER
jgi:hypothetical protein